MSHYLNQWPLTDPPVAPLLIWINCNPDMDKQLSNVGWNYLCQPAVGVEWAEWSQIIGTGYWVEVFAWSSVTQSVCQGAFSLLEIRFQRPGVRILHSAEEDNLFPSYSKTACLCQSNEINNNKHVYRQSQVRKPNGSGVEWAECSLIIRTGYWVQVFAGSWIAQSVCQRAFSLLEIRFQRPWVRIVHLAEEDNLSPFDSKIACLCQSIEINNNKHSQTLTVQPLKFGNG